MTTVTGLDQIGAAIRRLQQAERDLPKETRRALRTVAPRLVSDAERHAEQVLPRRGGYARQVATTTRFRVEVNRTSRGTTLRITAVGPDYRLDRQGRLRHPVYADGPRSDWAWAKESQRVVPGWFTRPMEAGRSDVRVVLEVAESRAIRGR